LRRAPFRHTLLLRLRAAEGVALGELELPRLHVPLDRDLRSVVGVPRTGILDLDVEVRRDARPANFDAIGAAVPGGPLRMSGERHVGRGPERVAEDAGRIAEDDRRLALPARPVRGF